MVKKFPPHCPEIFSWSNIEFQQSPLFTAVGGLGGEGGAQEIKGFWCIQHQHFSQTRLNSASCRNSIGCNNLKPNEIRRLLMASICHNYILLLLALFQDTHNGTGKHMLTKNCDFFHLFCQITIFIGSQLFWNGLTGQFATVPILHGVFSGSIFIIVITGPMT